MRFLCTASFVIYRNWSNFKRAVKTTVSLSELVNDGIALNYYLKVYSKSILRALCPPGLLDNRTNNYTKAEDIRVS